MSRQTAKQRVRAKVPHARAVHVEVRGIGWAIVRGATETTIGYGKTLEAAWADAARRL